MTKIIGTGLSGLVGSRLVELLQKKFEFVDFSLDSGVDITKLSSLKKAFLKHLDCEAVIHLAAFTDVSEAAKQEGNKKGLCYQINVIGTQNTANLCQEYGKYLIHISTDFVFDGKKKTAYTEEDKPYPIEWYGHTKYLAEKIVQQSKNPWLIARIAYPFKAKPSQRNLEPKPKIDLVRKIIEKLENDQEVKMFTDQIITPTLIDDIAHSVDIIVRKKPTGVYHVVGSSFISPYNLALKICKILNLDKTKVKKTTLLEFQRIDPRPRQKYLKLSNIKIQKDLNIKISSIDQALNSAFIIERN
jgi:dTDP-4-dehydrorhamnose reductase